MSSSKSHYHRNRLLRDRIHREEANHSAPPPGAGTAGDDDNFELPDYFSTLPANQGEIDDEFQGRYPKVVLWDEVV